MGTIAAILYKSVAVEPDRVRNMVASARHLSSGDSTVKVVGSCVLAVANACDALDSVVSSEGPWMAAFTGKLDNVPETVELLEKRGFRPASANPADLVVAAFQAFGVSAPSRLRGPFAAILTNGSELWCFRDQLGWRPLHYRDEPTRFVVATAPRQVVAGAGIRNEPDLDVLEKLYYGRLTKDSPAALKGVQRLPQATVLSVDSSGRVALQPYWHPAELLETARFRDAEVGDRFAEVFGRAVARSLTGEDVVSLSGGIDSPAVAGFAAPLFRELTGRPLPALSTVYPDHPKVDESRYIELAARYLGMELHTFVPGAGPWVDILHWSTVFDGPIPTLALGEVADYYHRARELGYRNVLGGDIAEAVFNLNRHVVGHLVTRGRWKALLTMSRTLRSQGTSLAGLAKYMIAPFIPGRLAVWYAHERGLDFPQRLPHWVSAAKANEVPFRQDLARPGRDRWTGIQLYPFEGTSLTLEAGEACALLCGATSRSPFADVDVIEFFLSLPAEIKFPDMQSKTLMRRMLRGRVPDEILDRRDKTVFGQYTMSHIDYGALRSFLVNPATRIAGVDYEALASRIERQDFTLVDYVWTNDLLRIHAFLSQW